jgi:hypothetical protein
MASPECGTLVVDTAPCPERELQGETDERRLRSRTYLRRKTMAQDEDPVFTHPESYGIENLEAPGEPDREDLPPVVPVPGTGRTAREEHQRQHNEQGQTARGSDYRDRREREEREEARREVEEPDADLAL